MLLKALIFLWIGISYPRPSQDAADFIVDFMKMRNPFNWTYSKEDVPKNQEGNEGGIQRRHALGEVGSKEETGVQEPQPAPEGVRHFAGLSKAMADKLEREIEMVLGLAEEGANVTLNTDMQLVIKQRTEEFLITLDQALTASRRSTTPSGKIEEDQEGEAEAVFQPSARVAESKEGRKGETLNAQVANSSADALSEASRSSIEASGEAEKDEEREADVQPRVRAAESQEGSKGISQGAQEAKHLDQAPTTTRGSIRPSERDEEDQEGEEEADFQPRTRAAENREGRTSSSQDAKEAKYLDPAMMATRGSNTPSGKVEEDQEGEEVGHIQPSARVADGRDERKGRSRDVDVAKSPVDPLTNAREKSVFFFNKTDEAKRVIEEDRQRQNYQGYSIIGGYTVNAILEPIGIALLEDIFSALERARKRFAAWMFNIEGYMKSYSWQHLFPDLYGAGPSTLHCSSKDLVKILDDFERRIPHIFTTAEATIATERLRSEISVAISCILYDKNEYAEVVRVRQLVEEVVDAYSQAIQVPERNSDIDMMSGYYFHILASSWDKLESLHQDATNKIQGFRAYKNSMTVVGSLITHLGTAGKCVLNVLIAHDVFSERIAEAPNAEEEQWEKIKLIITDATLTGGCLASGFSYAQNILSQLEPHKIECGRPDVLHNLLKEYDYMRTPRDLVKLTGSAEAATKYIKSFEKEFEVKLHCVTKEKDGAKFLAEMSKYIQLVRNSLVLFD